MANIIGRRGFSMDLTIEDRRKLRAIVLKVHKHLFAVDASTKHLDQMIDAIGPLAAQKLILKAGDRVG